MGDDIDKRIAENDRQRFALDQKITAMRGELAALNRIAKERPAAAVGRDGGVNAAVAGAVLTGGTKKR